LDERLRHYYLDALGVESYVPRVLLSGAAPSPVCELADLYDEEIAESVDTILTTAKPVEAKPETVATKSSPMAASVIAGVMDEAPGKKADSHTAQTNTEKTRAAQKSRRVELNCWRVGASLMVLDTRQSRLALPTDTLFSNIVRALGYSPTDIAKPTIVRSTGKGLTSTAAESHVMVQAFLTAQYERQPFTQLLLMGTTAARFGLNASGLAAIQKLTGGAEKPVDFRDAIMGKKLSMTNPDCIAVIVPSLVDMLQTPSIKALTWQTIQGFIVSSANH